VDGSLRFRQSSFVCAKAFVPFVGWFSRSCRLRKPLGAYMNANYKNLQTAFSLLIGCYTEKTGKNIANIAIIELIE
jgi:hypothetical protein